MKEQQERELERKHQGVQREQEQLAEQQKLLRHQLEATKLKQEQYHKSQLLQKQKEPKPEQYHHNKRVRTLYMCMECVYVHDVYVHAVIHVCTYVYKSCMHEVEYGVCGLRSNKALAVRVKKYDVTVGHIKSLEHFSHVHSVYKARFASCHEDLEENSTS